MAVGQCKHILITNIDGGILNDPVLMWLAENHFWLALADNDILLWAQGVAINSGLDITIAEPDVSPLQLQGPKSGKIMQALFGDSIMDLRYYWLREVVLDGIPLVVSRTGWSSELGYEIYLRNGAQGYELWEKIMAIGGAAWPKTWPHIVYPTNSGGNAFVSRRCRPQYQPLLTWVRPSYEPGHGR